MVLGLTPSRKRVPPLKGVPDLAKLLPSVYLAPRWTKIDSELATRLAKNRRSALAWQRAGGLALHPRTCSRNFL